MTVDVTLFCLPYAGAGAAVYLPWRNLGIDRLTIEPVQLPGRERLIAQTPFRDVRECADHLIPQILGKAEPGAPVAFFGHSVGAVLAYELARRLVLESGLNVAHLFVSGSAGPRWRRERRASGLDDDAFVDRVRELAGYRDQFLDIPEMREVLLPVLRADVEMHENYVDGGGEPLPVPVTSMRGRDDELVSSEQSRQWRDATSEAFRHAEFDGGHMYLTDRGRQLLELISAETAATLSTAHA